MSLMLEAATSSDTCGIGQEQTRLYAAAVGRSTAELDIESLLRIAEQARPLPIYSSHLSSPFVYEILSSDGWREATSRVVDQWAENEDNVHRAERHVGRITTLRGSDLVRAFCMFKLKNIERSFWSSVRDGHGHDTIRPQTVVYIALTDLDPSNGFFMKLKRGEDVCVDSVAEIKFPSAGGGLGVFISLRL